MHDSVLAWVPSVLRTEEVAGKSVLEVGSYDVNGSVRPLITALGPARYVGVDHAAGPGVDHVCLAEEIPNEMASDLVVSTEMLEHAEFWQRAFLRMCELVLPGGVLLLTARGPGFRYHNPPDYWRFVPSDLRLATLLCGLWPVVCEWDPQIPGVFLKAEKREYRPVVSGLGSMPQVGRSS